MIAVVVVDVSCLQQRKPVNLSTMTRKSLPRAEKRSVATVSMGNAEDGRLVAIGWLAGLAPCLRQVSHDET